MKRTVLKLNLTAEQQRKIVKIQNNILTEHPETVGLTLMEFALKFHEVYGFGIIHGIATGEGPAELTAESLQKLLRFRQGNNRVHVELTTDDLARICSDLASELWHDIHFSHLAGIKDDDFAAIIAVWRKYAPHYVKSDIRSGTSREEATSWRKMHDEAADLLERMLAVKSGQSVAA